MLKEVARPEINGKEVLSWERALALMEGKIDVKPLITDVFKIEEWEEPSKGYRRERVGNCP